MPEVAGSIPVAPTLYPSFVQRDLPSPLEERREGWFWADRDDATVVEPDASSAGR
jgi:hypothetical protein